MRIKNYFSCVCAALIAALSLAGCTDYDNGYTEKAIAYDKHFTDLFGQIDPNQDWNLVRQLANKGEGHSTKATVYDPSGGFTITKLDEYAYFPIADVMAYRNEMRESEVWERDYKDTNLDKVTQDFKVTASSFILYPFYWVTSSEDIIGIYYDVDAKDPDAIHLKTTNNEDRYIKRVPICQGSYSEELYAIYEFYGFLGNPNIWGDFAIKYIDELIAAPSNGKELYCTYTKENDGKYYATVGENKTEITPDMGQLKEEICNDLITIAPDKFAYTGDENIEVDKIYYSDRNTTCSKGCYIYKLDYSDANEYLLAKENNVFEATHDKETLEPKAVGLKSYGIEVTIPAEITEYGFYIQNGGLDENSNDNTNGNTNIKYSEAILNKKIDFKDIEGEQEVSYVTTFDGEDGEGNSCRYLCFEDWFSGSTNFDLNDVVFRVVGIEPDEVIDYDKVVDTRSGLLVCEDLGDFDFDFNDVVLKLEHKQVTENFEHASGEVEELKTNTLTVTAMAAGGALPSYIYYMDKNGKEQPLSVDGTNEIHKLLNGVAPDIINAGENFGKEGKKKVLHIGTDMADWDDTKYPESYIHQVFAEGYVFIRVEDSENGRIIEPIHNSTEGYENHSSPQMMLLPINFQWPQEHMTIDEVYPGFENWVGDVNQTDWYTEYDETLITKRGTGTKPSTPDPTDPDPTEPGEPSEKNGKDLFFKTEHAPQSGSWSGRSSTYLTDLTLDYELKEGDNIYIYITNENGVDYTREGVTATYKENSYNIGQNQFNTPNAIAIPITGSGEQTVTLHAPANDDGYGERTITITFTVGSTSGGDSGNGGATEDKYTAEYGSKYNVSDQYNCRTFKANTIKETAPVKVSFIIEGDYYSGYGEYKDFIVTWNNNQSWDNYTECETTVETISETSPTYTVLSTVLTADDLKDLDYIGTSVYHGGTCVGAYVQSVK